MGAVASTEEALAIWADASTLDTEQLEQLLDDAWDEIQHRRFTSEQADDYEPTSAQLGRWKRANVLHARELHLAAQRDGDVIATGDQALRAREVTPTVMALLRPPTGLPQVG